MDNTVTVKELRQQFPHISQRIRNGEEIVLVYHSRPLCKMVPLNLKKHKRKGLDWSILKKAYFTSEKTAVELVRDERI